MSDIYIGKLVSSNYLEHHGILGMKWGIRRYQNKDGSLTKAGKDREKKAAARKQEKELKKKELAAYVHNKAHEYDRKKNWHEAYNKAANEFNTRINAINAKYTGKNLGENFETKDGQKYVTEVGKMWKEVYSKAAVDRFGTTLSVSSDGSIKEGRDFVNNMPYMNQYDEFIKR